MSLKENHQQTTDQLTEISAKAQKYEEALSGLAQNTQRVYGYEQPVLIEGGDYPGIWLECGPLEGIIYGKYAPSVAKANHEVFFHHQRQDGYLPYRVSLENEADSPIGSSQIQMVVPIARTALETAELIEDDVYEPRGDQGLEECPELGTQIQASGQPDHGQLEEEQPYGEDPQETKMLANVTEQDRTNHDHAGASPFW